MNTGRHGLIKKMNNKIIKKVIILLFILSFFSFLIYTKTKNSLLQYSVKRISERVLVLSGKIVMMNNITAILTEKGIVVIDTSFSPTLASDMRKTIEEEFGRKYFTFVINTHSHWDHVFGNQVFKEATIIAHKNTPAAIRNESPPCNWFRAKANSRKKDLKGLKPDSKKALELQEWIGWVKTACGDIDKNYIQTLPTKTFKDKLVLNMGDLSIELYYFGNAHSDNDIIVHIPQERILFTGDLFLDGQMMSGYKNNKKLDIPRWIETLDKLLKKGNKIKYVIPGHKSIWKTDQLEIRYRYIKKLWTSLKKARTDGLNLDKVYESLSIKNGFSHLSKIGIKFVDAVHKKYINLFWEKLQQQEFQKVKINRGE